MKLFAFFQHKDETRIPNGLVAALIATFIAYYINELMSVIPLFTYPGLYDTGGLYIWLVVGSIVLLPLVYFVIALLLSPEKDMSRRRVLTSITIAFVGMIFGHVLQSLVQITLTFTGGFTTEQSNLMITALTIALPVLGYSSALIWLRQTKRWK